MALEIEERAKRLASNTFMLHMAQAAKERNITNRLLLIHFPSIKEIFLFYPIIFFSLCSLNKIYPQSFINIRCFFGKRYFHSQFPTFAN
jgi:hypothetical protein